MNNEIDEVTRNKIEGSIWSAAWHATHSANSVITRDVNWDVTRVATVGATSDELDYITNLLTKHRVYR